MAVFSLKADFRRIFGAAPRQFKGKIRLQRRKPSRVGPRRKVYLVSATIELYSDCRKKSSRRYACRYRFYFLCRATWFPDGRLPLPSLRGLFLFVNAASFCLFFRPPPFSVLGLIALTLVIIGLARTFQEPITTTTSFETVELYEPAPLTICGLQGMVWPNGSATPFAEFTIEYLYYRTEFSNGSTSTTFVNTANVNPAPVLLGAVPTKLVNLPAGTVVRSNRDTLVVDISPAPCFTISASIMPTISPGSAGRTQLVVVLGAQYQTLSYSLPNPATNNLVYTGIYKSQGVEDFQIFTGQDTNLTSDLTKSEIRATCVGNTATFIDLEEARFTPINKPARRSFSAQTSSARYFGFTQNRRFPTPFPPTEISILNQVVNWINRYLPVAFVGYSGSGFPNDTGVDIFTTSANFAVIVGWRNNIVVKIEEKSAIDPLIIIGSLVTILTTCVVVLGAVLSLVIEWKAEQAVGSLPKE